MRTAVVTGATRGLGRGVAISLADADFRVFATGRHIQDSDLPSAVTRIACDHLDDSQTLRAFERITAEAGPIELLVNCAWGGYERMVEDDQFTWPAPFWQQPLHRWTGMIDAGVRAAFVCAACAARAMVPQRRGLIVNISYWAAQKYLGNVIYGMAKAATDKMTADMAHELRPHRVAVISLYPGLVRTESVLAAGKAGWLDLSNSESPELTGRVISAVANADDLMEHSGKVLVVAAVARELGIADVDGRQPSPLTLDTS